MATTYDETLPTDKDKARALLGDTDMSAPLLTDEHIVTVISQQGGFALGVAWLADELIAQLAQQPGSVSIGGITVSWKDRLEAWKALAARMRAKAADEAAAAAGIARRSVFVDVYPVF